MLNNMQNWISGHIRPTSFPIIETNVGYSYQYY